jgi:hypothetical protein
MMLRATHRSKTRAGTFGGLCLSYAVTYAICLPGGRLLTAAIRDAKRTGEDEAVEIATLGLGCWR